MLYQKKYNFVLFIIILLCGHRVNSQTQFVPVAPATPSANAIGLGQYGEIPVSLFTGVPNIEVAIHTLNKSQVQVPISLNYHAGGFRPDIQPSWVGMNWSLNAGGVITREVRNIPDENEGTSSLNLVGKGFYYTYNELNKANWSTPGANDIPSGHYIDREPDIFKFNFLDYSGEFFLDHNRQWKVRSDHAIRVEFEENDFIYKFTYFNNSPVVSSGLKTFNKFTLTDDWGNKYVFGTEQAIEYSVGIAPYQFDYSFTSAATSWYLVKIIPQSGNEITFSYERGPYQSSFSYFQHRNHCSAGAVGGNGFLATWGYTLSQTNGLSGSLISPVYLTRIESLDDNLSIVFFTSKSQGLKYPESVYLNYFANQNYHNGTPHLPLPSGYLSLNQTVGIPYFLRNPQEGLPTPGTLSAKFVWLKLDSIQFNYTNSFNFSTIRSKKVSFHYEETPQKRLSLDSLSTSFAGSTFREVYRFKYNGNLTQPPGYLEELTDHWGYSNAVPLPKDAVQPYVYHWIGNMEESRSPHTNRSTAGLLEEIRYPTGGVTKFYFESHDYADIVGDNRVTAYPAGSNYTLAGGARIKRVETYDGKGGVHTKQYYYVEDFDPLKLNGRKSSGILNAAPKYRFGFTQVINGVPAQVYAYNSSSITPLTGVSTGRHIGYSTVTERHMDGSYKTFYFTNDMQGNADDAPANIVNSSFIPHVPYNSKEFERGKPASEFTYAGYAQNNKLLESKLYTYTKVGYNLSNYIRSVRFDFTVWCNNPDGTHSAFPAMTAYYNYAYAYMNSGIVKTSYTDSGEIKEEMSYVYDEERQLLKQTQRTSDGKTIETHYSYPHTDNPTSGVLLTMKNKHMRSYPVFIRRFQGEKEKLLGGTRNTYTNFQNNSFVALSATDEILPSGAFSPVYTYSRYDSKGRMLEAFRKGIKPETFLYGFRGGWLVAVVEGATYAQVTSLVSIDTLTGRHGETHLVSSLKRLHDRLRGALVNSFTYHVDGSLVSRRVPSGTLHHFRYDHSGRLEQERNMDNELVASYKYNIGSHAPIPGVFYNVALSQTFMRNNCPSGYTGQHIEYVVPAGKYVSTVSQANANALAQQDINANGQQFANTHAGCSMAGVGCSIALNSNWQMLSHHVYPTGSATQISYLVMQAVNIGAHTAPDWYNNGVAIGNIEGPCVPYQTKYAYQTIAGRQWVISIDPAGIIKIRIQNTNAAYPQNNEIIEFSNLTF